jgi:hypothetical protein
VERKKFPKKRRKIPRKRMPIFVKIGNEEVAVQNDDSHRNPHFVKGKQHPWAFKKGNKGRPKGGGNAKCHAWNEFGLNPRLFLFVKAYTGPAGGNILKALRMAGYNCTKGGGYVKLNFPHVQAAIAREMANKMMSPQWAKDLLGDACRASMANFVTVDEDGFATIDMKKALRHGAMGQLQEYNEDLDKAGNVVARRVKVKPNHQALGLLLKHFRLVNDIGFDDAEIAAARKGPAVEEYDKTGAVEAPQGTVPVGN